MYLLQNSTLQAYVAAVYFYMEVPIETENLRGLQDAPLRFGTTRNTLHCSMCSTLHCSMCSGKQEPSASYATQTQAAHAARLTPFCIYQLALWLQTQLLCASYQK